MHPKQRIEIAQRLSNVAARLTNVIKMVEGGCSSVQTLRQLNEIKSSLRAIEGKFIICQSQFCLTVMTNSSFAKQRKGELKCLRSLYMLFLQYTNHQAGIVNIIDRSDPFETRSKN